MNNNFDLYESETTTNKLYKIIIDFDSNSIISKTEIILCYFYF